MKEVVNWEDAAEAVVQTITYADGSSSTNVRWMSRNGRLYESEHDARWGGTTGTIPCQGRENCPNRHTRSFGSCTDCLEASWLKGILEQMVGRPRWEGQFPCWLDRDFCFNAAKAEEWLDCAWDEEKGYPTPVVREAFPSVPPHLDLLDLACDYGGEDDDFAFALTCPAAKAIEAMVDAYVLEAIGPRWEEGLPYSGGFEEWAEANVDNYRSWYEETKVRKYTCAACSGEFEDGWTEEEAAAEARANFGGDALDYPCVRVCDPCYQKHISKVEEAIKDPAVQAEFEAWKANQGERGECPVGVARLSPYPKPAKEAE